MEIVGIDETKVKAISEKKKESSAGNNESQMEEIDINFFN